MIVTYNKEQVGDVLMLTLKNSGEAKLAVERKGKVARVYREDKQRNRCLEYFDASSFFAIEGKGQVFLTDEQVARLNQELKEKASQNVWSMIGEPKFVVGEILEMVAHPDSDHLNICQVAVGPDKTVQIVAGAPNARVGLKTIVALPGAMMPDGSLIFPGAPSWRKAMG